MDLEFRLGEYEESLNKLKEFSEKKEELIKEQQREINKLK